MLSRASQTESTTKELDEILNRGNDGLEVNNDIKNSLYYIDIQTKFPTVHQFKSIHQYASKNEENKAVFAQVFPKFSDLDMAIGHSVDPESPVLRELAERQLVDISKEVFNPPLVVDWSKGLIRNTAEGLNDMVSNYK